LLGIIKISLHFCIFSDNLQQVCAPAHAGRTHQTDRPFFLFWLAAGATQAKKEKTSAVCIRYG